MSRFSTEQGAMSHSRANRTVQECVMPHYNARISAKLRTVATPKLRKDLIALVRLIRTFLTSC
jgi:hypothetical protein